MNPDIALSVGLFLGVVVGLVWQALWPLLPSRWKRAGQRRWSR